MTTRAPRGPFGGVVRLLAAVAFSFVAACGSGGPTPSPFANVDAGKAPPPPQRGPGAAPEAPAASFTVPKVEFHEDDFAETEKSRDPFHSFAMAFSEQSKTRIKSQRQVLLDHFAIDDLKLIGLVTRTDTPRAMLVDPSGRGWVVIKGQFIGRPEIVHTGGPGGVDYELNWRVDRIREGDLVLVREDPAHADVAPVTRVIALRAPGPAESIQ
ncbi:MAG TPA: pilus assembly protein PilP [Polyangiaceae bacterium]|nr:pilus assembly protein PilP [Polyangiaceae bacterium]